MAIVTGDRYLDRLGQFVEKQAGSLLEGSLVLKVNPVGLHYVQTRLDALHELERLWTAAPVDYLRAYISDLGDHRALEQLSRFLSLLPAVTVVSVLPPPDRDPCPLALSPFGRLRSLELRGCDLSTSPARGLLQLRPILERLICHNSTDALRHIFTERIQEVEKSQVWTRLAFVSCPNNGMFLMDDSLQLLPAVQSLDLSRNRFVKAANLHCCGKLTYLDLGFNQLRNISSLKQVTSQITKLVLKNNALASLQGISALTSLEALDLSNNLISKFNEIHSVATIPSLQIMFLEGNPISTYTFYREEIYSFFPNPTKICLDGKKVSTLELWRVHRITSRRQQFETMYGSYNPVRPSDMQVDLQHASDDGNSVSRRKSSRLALIHDAEMAGGEVEDDESSGFSAVSSHSRDATERRQEVSDVNSQHKLEAIQLMQKAEALKVENSMNWLQELRLLLDNNEVLARQDSCPNNGLQNESSKLKELRKFWRQRKRQQYRISKAESRDVQESRKNLEREVEHDKHLKDDGESSLLSQDANNFFISSETGPGKSATVNLHPHMKNGRGILEQSDMTHTCASSMNSISYGKQASTGQSFDSWKFIGEVVESQRMTHHVPSSPPHFHEDVLQRRQDLADDLIWHTLKSGSALSSSDSESSIDTTSSSSGSSDDNDKDLIELQRDRFEPDYEEAWKSQPLTSNQVEDCMSKYGLKETVPNHQTGTNGIIMVQARTLGPSMPEENTIDALQADDVNPSSTNDIQANAAGVQKQLISEMWLPESRKKPRKVRTAQVYDEACAGQTTVMSEDGVADPRVVEHPKALNEGKRSVPFFTVGSFASGNAR